MRNNRKIRLGKNLANIEIDWISVLLNKTKRIILHWSRIMQHNKLLTGFSSLFEVLVGSQIILELGGELLVGTIGHADLVENGEDGVALGASDQVDTELVVLVCDALPWHFLFLVFGLLH